MELNLSTFTCPGEVDGPMDGPPDPCGAPLNMQLYTAHSADGPIIWARGFCTARERKPPTPAHVFRCPVEDIWPVLDVVKQAVRQLSPAKHAELCMLIAERWALEAVGGPDTAPVLHMEFIGHLKMFRDTDPNPLVSLSGLIAYCDHAVETLSVKYMANEAA
jgi:hypothetical protein